MVQHYYCNAKLAITGFTDCHRNYTHNQNSTRGQSRDHCTTYE